MAGDGKRASRQDVMALPTAGLEPATSCSTGNIEKTWYYAKSCVFKHLRKSPNTADSVKSSQKQPHKCSQKCRHRPLVQCAGDPWKTININVRTPQKTALQGVGIILGTNARSKLRKPLNRECSPSFGTTWEPRTAAVVSGQDDNAGRKSNKDRTVSFDVVDPLGGERLLGRTVPRKRGPAQRVGRNLGDIVLTEALQLGQKLRCAASIPLEDDIGAITALA